MPGALKKKPRIDDAGPYSLSSRFEKGCIRGWFPGSSTRRTKSCAEVILCYYTYNNKKKVLRIGHKPAYFPVDKAITQKDWKRSFHKGQEPTNAVLTGFRFVEYLKDNPDATYDDLAADAGITKARVCQMIALCKRLPTEITEFLMTTHEPEVLRYFSERRLRTLTRLASDEDKITKFNKMMEVIS